MIVWHYTIGDHLPSIIGEWTIRTANASVQRGERPIAWFSTNAHWEQSARKGIYDVRTGKTHTASMEETHERANGLYRIGAREHVARHRWASLRKHIPVEIANSLVRSAMDLGANPAEWRGSFYPVSLSKCEVVERWTGSEWEWFADLGANGMSVPLLHWESLTGESYG